MAWLGEFQLQFYTTHFLTAGYDLDTISRMTPEVRSWPLTPSRPAPCLSRLRPPSTALKSAPHRPGWCHHDPPVSVTWPPGVSPEPQPVTPHTLSASFTYLCSHMAVCSSLCCKRYSLFVLECVFSAGVCVRVCLCMCLCIEADTMVWRKPPQGRGHSPEIIQSKIFLRAYHMLLMYKCQTCT